MGIGAVEPQAFMPFYAHVSLVIFIFDAPGSAAAAWR